jgi:hypothetical protein
VGLEVVLGVGEAYIYAVEACAADEQSICTCMGLSGVVRWSVFPKSQSFSRKVSPFVHCKSPSQ